MIPPKVETKLFVRMTPTQHHWYKKVLEKDLITLNTGNFILFSYFYYLFGSIMI